MTDLGDSFREHRDHLRDVKSGIVRCQECGRPTEPSRKTPRMRWCSACRRLFKTPQWALDQERP